MPLDLVAGENELNIALTPRVIQINAYSQAAWFTKRGTIGDKWLDARESPTGSADMVNYGTQSGFHWYTDPVIMRSAIYFSLSSIPAGATIIAAKLIARVYSWKYGDSGMQWLPADHILLDFPTHSWPIASSDYGKIHLLTDEIIRWHYATPGWSRYETIQLPQHTIDMMNEQPRLAIAEKCSVDHDNVGARSARIFGARTYTESAGYHAYLQVQVQMPEGT